MCHSKIDFYVATSLALSQAAMVSSHARVPKIYLSNNDIVSVVDIPTEFVGVQGDVCDQSM